MPEIFAYEAVTLPQVLHKRVSDEMTRMLPFGAASTARIRPCLSPIAAFALERICTGIAIPTTVAFLSMGKTPGITLLTLKSSRISDTRELLKL
jgi:hypothetical protein